MDLRGLDLNLLLVLDAMFEERQTVAVAGRLKVSQPTVSTSLRKLREFFDDDLFVRAGGKMQPTPFAETLHAPLRRMMETLRIDILRGQDFNALTTERQFTFSMSDIGELVFLPAILSALRAEAPRATVRSLSCRPNDLIASMADGTIDIALGYFPDLTGAGFYQQSLFEHHFTCLVRRDHPTIGTTISIDQFCAAEHAVVMQEGRSQEIFERRMAELKLARRVLLQSPHFMTVPLLVANSDMIATVPQAVGKAYARLAALRLIDPPISIPAIELNQFWHRRVHHDPAVVWLRKLVARLLRRHDPSAEGASPLFGEGAGPPA